MENLNYFREIVTTDRRAKELATFPGRVIGTLCNFVPEELIYAAGAIPVRLCAGDYAAIVAGEEILPRDICSVAKATAGLIRQAQGLYGRVDVLVIPTPCDAKKKLGSLLTDFKPVHVLELPPNKTTSAAREFWLEQVEQFQRMVEEWTGHRITRTHLQAAIVLLNRRQEVFRRFLKLRQSDPPLISGEEALFVTGASFHDDIYRWIEQTERLCEELEERQRNRDAASKSVTSKQSQISNFKSSPRLLLTGAPLIWPNFKVVQLLEERGAVVVADELCSGTQRLYQRIALREWSLREMLWGVADKYLLPPTCPCFVDNTDRLNRILELAEEFRVDGIVYHNLRICPLFDLESVTIQRELKQRGLPVLTLYTDYSREDLGQLRTRIEAFLEMISG